MNKDIKDFTDLELYKAKAELLQEALTLNANISTVNAEIERRKPLPESEKKE